MTLETSSPLSSRQTSLLKSPVPDVFNTTWETVRAAESELEVSVIVKSNTSSASATVSRVVAMAIGSVTPEPAVTLPVTS